MESIGMPRVMQDQTLEAFDTILNDGTLEGMQMTALQLVLENPDMTVRELLQIGVDEGVYTNADRNVIAPRITSLAKEIVIVRPAKRPCRVTGKRAWIHRIAPDNWRNRRREYITRCPGRKYIRHRMEIESDSKPGLYHTVIMWTDGSVDCTCQHTYHRALEFKNHCTHAIGMITADTGRLPNVLQKGREAAV